MTLAGDSRRALGRPLPRSARAVVARAAHVLQANVFVVLVLAVLGTLQVILVRRAVVTDAWYTILGGRLVVHSGLPSDNGLTVLAHGRAWVDQQWLGQVLVYGLWSAGGWAAPLLAGVAFYVAAFAFSAAAARLTGASERSVALVLTISFLTGLSNTVLRAQIPAYTLFALLLLLLLTDQRRPGARVFVTLPLLVVWANIHGSVVIGAALVALYGATGALAHARRRAPLRAWLPRTAALVLLPWPCTLASPYGVALVGYYRHFFFNTTLPRLVTEWAPSTVRSEPIFYAALLAALFLAFRQRRALALFSQLALVGSGVGGLLANRNIVWFALVAAAVVPLALDELWPPRQAVRHVRANLAITAAAVAALAIAAGSAAAHDPSWYERSYPRGAADVVAAAAAADPHVRVFANERYADWLLFEHPELAGRVAFDARFELLSDAQLQRIADFVSLSGADWQEAARGYGLLVLTPHQKAVAYYRRHGARTLYRDPHVVVLHLEAAESRG